MLRKITFAVARIREPEKERQEKKQVYIWPLFPSSFPLRKHILLLADCGSHYVCCTWTLANAPWSPDKRI